MQKFIILKLYALNKDLRIICITKPDWYNDEFSEQRRDIIKKTVDNAIVAGDKNVYFIDDKQFYYDFVVVIL